MPITYDLETDIRYLQGFEKANFNTVKRLLNLGYTDTKEIALISDVDEKEVQRIKNDIELDTQGVPIEEIERIKSDLADSQEEEKGEGETPSPDNQDTENTE